MSTRYLPPADFFPQVNADVNTSVGCMNYALWCEEFVRMYPHDPAARMYARDKDWFLNEAVRLERCGI